MILRLQREPSTVAGTFGALYLSDHFACFTLEDEIREEVGKPVSTWKVPTQTAIPGGRYRVIITPSVRFQRPLPLLVDVPGFAGVRIHPGNTIHDTEGCILVGQDRDDQRVLQSRVAFERLFNVLQVETGDMWIDVLNPPFVAGGRDLRAA